MPFTHGKNAKLLVDQFDLSPYLQKIKPSGERAVHDATTFGKSARVFVPGLGNGHISGEGFWDATLIIGSDAVLSAALSAATKKIVTHATAGTSPGARCVLAYGDESNYDISSPVDGLTSILTEIQSSSGLEAGVGLYDVDAPISAAMAGVGATSVNNSAATTGGAVAHLHVPAYTGAASTLIVKIQHSTNGTTWADLVTFSTLTAGTPGAQRVEVAGTVNQFVRAFVTLTGTGLTVSLAVAIARR